MMWFFVLLAFSLSALARKRTEDVYRTYHVVLRRRCLKLLRNETLADDAMQEVFWTICRNIEKYRGEPKDILPWLYRITTTHCFKLLDKNKRWNRNVDAMIEEGCARYEANLTDRELESKVAVQAMLEKLPETMREVVVYRYVSGLTQSEIAEVMDVSRDHVRTTLKRFQERAEKWQAS
ncbi:MAG TPA: hypothetical protein DCE42_06400 [Myxococcales bacterium]|nr:hypothetical protein [Deltaproteobacteria bacterium]MBU53840.1 hypothetical protein [Deltaproteobacteria bacterium]HAA54366.1 hypothetical protein [Myxococcales bacterium]|tara:strand:- start:75 stop:611 length:537 start_codon:yes stop_codon:yes gene_type:complete